MHVRSSILFSSMNFSDASDIVLKNHSDPKTAARAARKLKRKFKELERRDFTAHCKLVPALEIISAWK